MVSSNTSLESFYLQQGQNLFSSETPLLWESDVCRTPDGHWEAQEKKLGRMENR